MKAVVFYDVGDIRLENVAEPKIQQPEDAIVRITSSAICGTDLHFIRGTMSGMKKGRILGHEAVGIVEEVGNAVRNFRKGDRVIIPSTVGCGSCNYCRAGYYAQCNRANPGGPLAGTTFFGGPEDAGGLDGLQAEYARVPFAATNLVMLPEEISDDQAIMMSDILPTSYQAASMAEINSGDTVAIFGCGPVGMMAIACAQHLGAGRVFAIDQVASRLEMARKHGAEAIDFSKESPVEVLRELTMGSGPDRVIDAVGVDATCGSAKQQEKKKFEAEMKEIDPHANDAKKKGWWLGGAPTQALEWAVESVAKAGTLSVIGVYPPTLNSFPVGQMMNKNLTVKSGNCNHRKYLPRLVELVRSGVIRPEQYFTQKIGVTSAIDAYHHFDQHEHGWLKVKLEPAAAEKAA
ncbi:glutathione-dependent formaldehyde dehydrogenase [Edaphobacter sp. HDX4]|uniref:zinc-dependent alcohol dehydrogenase n=1 Tax=Edaphobacter sp. HDX4 TaxID=2794064 RepID=UPI002FE54E1A